MSEQRTDIILERLIEISERLADQGARVRSIEKAVTGNGQPGLQQRVGVLEANQNKTAGSVKAFKYIGGVGASMWGVFEYIIHFMHHADKVVK